MMKAPHSHSYPLLSALLFFFFVTWSSSGSLLSIWLHQEVGLKAGDTGIIYAVLSVSALFAQVCYGFIQDKLGLRKHLLWYITALLILSGPAYLLFGHLLKINVLLGSIFGGIYIGLTFNGGIGVLESYTERVARQSQFEFGRARMWGSLGWAVATFFAGLLFNINPQLNFLVASCSGLVFFILLARLRVSSAPHAMQEAVSGGKVTLEDALRLRAELEIAAPLGRSGELRDGVVREYVGHGVGHVMHEDPNVPNYGKRGRGVRLQAGMVIAIEPMITLGSYGTEVLANGWTVITDDHKAAAHYENTIAITKDGPVILTQDEVGPWLPMQGGEE